VIAILLILACVGLAASSPAAAQPDVDSSAWSDTLVFEPMGPTDSALVVPATESPEEWAEVQPKGDVEWLRAPFEEELLTDPDQWERSGRLGDHQDLLVDYNRVDQLRLGLRAEAQSPQTLYPRLGGRLEYAFGRKRLLYGALLDQPLAPRGLVSVGAGLYRRTDHSELQQVGDGENSLAFLLARQDYRDYFEREGLDGYVSFRLRPITNLSVHARSDDYRSLPRLDSANSLFYRKRALRENPPVDEGSLRSLAVRLERRALRTDHTRVGLYHWAELEWAGDRMGGDFDYTRALADMRSYLRLSPGQALALRLAAGSTPRGTLPFQKTFTVGGVDGLRAHRFAQYRGDRMLLGGAEYSVDLRFGRGWLREAPCALAFVDVGKAWNGEDHRYDLDRQHLEADGGIGLATAEDNLRLYFAKKLREPSSPFVVSLRLQRTF
jgi:hypothetical protein